MRGMGIEWSLRLRKWLQKFCRAEANHKGARRFNKIAAGDFLFHPRPLW